MDNALLQNEQYTKNPYRFGYIYDPPEQESDWLIVTFSAFPPASSTVKHQYSFTKLTKPFPCHRLFIQDTPGEMGCYYLCCDLNFKYNAAVRNLIKRICREHQIPSSHIITVGSSKGGTASLIYALQLHAGHCITMVPQTRIGSFVRSARPDIFRFMIGEQTDPDEGQRILDNVVFDQLKTRKRTVIHLLTTRGDSQFTEHIEPLIEQLQTCHSYYNDILINNRIANHHDISNFSREYFRETMEDILSGRRKWGGISEPYPRVSLPIGEIVLRHKITFLKRSVRIDLILSPKAGKMIPVPQFDFYLHRADRTVVERKYFSAKHSAAFRIPEPGRYYLRYYVKSGDEKISVPLSVFDFPATEAK